MLFLSVTLIIIVQLNSQNLSSFIDLVLFESDCRLYVKNEKVYTLLQAPTFL